MTKTETTIVGRFTPAETRRALEVCDSDQLAIWKPKWFAKYTGIPYGALMPFIHRYKEGDNKLGIASRSLINWFASECNAPRPRCYGQFRYYSELLQSIKELHPALKELDMHLPLCKICDKRMSIQDVVDQSVGYGAKRRLAYRACTPCVTALVCEVIRVHKLIV